MSHTHHTSHSPYSQRALLALLILAFVAACDDGGREPDYQFVSRGEGEANTEPLVVIRSGTRWPGGLVAGTITLEGRRLYRYFSTGGNAEELLWVTEAGIFVAGDSKSRLYAHPRLWLPATIRVGMRWRGHTDDDGRADYEYAVHEVSVADTVAGPRRVWKIGKNDPETGNTIEAVFWAEGLGVHREPGDPLYVAPLEDPPKVAIPTVSTSGLTPLLDAEGEPVVIDNFLVHGATRITPPTGPSLLWLDGAMWVYEQFESSGPTRQGHCYSWDGAGFGDVPTVDAVFEDGMLTGAVCPAGTVEGKTIVTGGLAWVKDDIHWLVMEGGPPMVDVFSARAAYLDADGDLALLASHGWQQAQYLETHKFATWPLTDNAMPTRRIWGGWSGPPWQGAILHGPGPVHGEPSFAFRDPGARLLVTTIDGDYLARPRLFFGPNGAVGRHVTREGQTQLFVTARGTVDRLVLDAGEARLERVAQLALPKGHWAQAVLDDGDRLLVYTTDGVRPRQNSIGTTFVWTAPLAPSPAAVPLFPELAPTVEWLGDDARVCWADTAEAVDPATWTIGGHPPAKTFVDPDAGCLTIIRDRDLEGPLDAYPHLIEGKIPGVGRMRLAGGTELGDFTMPVVIQQLVRSIASLTGGGSSSMTLVTAPGGFPASVPPRYIGEFGLWVPDRSGAGLWAYVADPDNVNTGYDHFLYLYDATPEAFLIGHWPTGDDPYYVRFSAEAGGIVFLEDRGSNDLLWHQRPDGTLTQLPDFPDGYYLQQIRANGELCGFNLYLDQVFCAAPDGTVLREAPGPAGFGDEYIPLGDGWYLALIASGVVGSVNLDTFETVTFTGVTQINRLSSDASGRLFAIARDAADTFMAVQVLPTGIVPVDELDFTAVTDRAPCPDGRPMGILALDEVVYVEVFGTDCSAIRRYYY